MKKIAMLTFSLVLVFAGLINSSMAFSGMDGMDMNGAHDSACLDTLCISDQASTSASSMECLQHCLSSAQTPVMSIASLNISIFLGGLLLFLLLKELIPFKDLPSQFFHQATSKLLLRKNLATVILLD